MILLSDETTSLFDTVDEAIKLAEKSVGTDYKVVLMPQGSLTVPLLKKD